MDVNRVRGVLTPCDKALIVLETNIKTLPNVALLPPPLGIGPPKAAIFFLLSLLGPWSLMSEKVSTLMGCQTLGEGRYH